MVDLLPPFIFIKNRFYYGNKNGSHAKILGLPRMQGRQSAKRRVWSGAAAMGSSFMGISRIAIISLSLLLFEHVASVTLMRFTQQRGNVALRPAATVMVLCTEFGKLVLSALLEHTHCFGIGSAQPLSQVAKSALVVKELARVSVPAVLYTIQNNLIFVSLGNLELVTFQVGEACRPPSLAFAHSPRPFTTPWPWRETLTVALHLAHTPSLTAAMLQSTLWRLLRRRLLQRLYVAPLCGAFLWRLLRRRRLLRRPFRRAFFLWRLFVWRLFVWRPFCRAIPDGSRRFSSRRCSTRAS